MCIRGFSLRPSGHGRGICEGFEGELWVPLSCGGGGGVSRVQIVYTLQPLGAAKTISFSLRRGYDVSLNEASRARQAKHYRTACSSEESTASPSEARSMVTG